MNLLFRLKNFEDIEEVHDYFKNILPIRDDNYFFNVNKMHQIKAKETMYFAFAGYIVATATFIGETQTDITRDEKFIFGLKLIDIKTISSNVKLDVKIFGTNTTYLNTAEKLDEIKKLL